MPRIVTPLTDSKIKNAKILGKDYSLADGDGLYLLVTKTGSKIWRFNYYKPIVKTRALISFGSYPEVSLQYARKQRDNARELIYKGIDPLENRNSIKLTLKNEKLNTFTKVVNDWFLLKKSGSLKEKTLHDIRRSLDNHIIPYIGDKPITQIKASNVINALEPLKNAGKFEAIKRVNQRVNEIMNYAINIGLLNINPLININSAFENPKTKHRPTINADQLPEFMKKLSTANIELQTRCLIEWQLLTMTRPSEAVNVLWSEIDLNMKLWVVPAEKMKMKREHTIPLSPQAIRILDIMNGISGHRNYVFPSMKPPFQKPMNSSTANMAIKRMGYKDTLVAHGLRSLASTILNDSLKFNSDVIEAALAHIDKNSVRKAYNRAEYIDARKELLDWWGMYIMNASKGSTSLSSQ